MEKGGRKKILEHRGIEEAPENGKESSYSAHANGMKESHKRYDFRGEKKILIIKCLF